MLAASKRRGRGVSSVPARHGSIDTTSVRQGRVTDYYARLDESISARGALGDVSLAQFFEHFELAIMLARALDGQLSGVSIEDMISALSPFYNRSATNAEFNLGRLVMRAGRGEYLSVSNQIPSFISICEFFDAFRVKEEVDSSATIMYLASFVSASNRIINSVRNRVLLDPLMQNLIAFSGAARVVLANFTQNLIYQEIDILSAPLLPLVKDGPITASVSVCDGAGNAILGLSDVFGARSSSSGRRGKTAFLSIEQRQGSGHYKAQLQEMLAPLLQGAPDANVGGLDAAACLTVIDNLAKLIDVDELLSRVRAVKDKVVSYYFSTVAHAEDKLFYHSITRLVMGLALLTAESLAGKKPLSTISKSFVPLTQDRSKIKFEISSMPCRGDTDDKGCHQYFRLLRTLEAEVKACFGDVRAAKVSSVPILIHAANHYQTEPAERAARLAETIGAAGRVVNYGVVDEAGEIIERSSIAAEDGRLIIGSRSAGDIMSPPVIAGIVSPSDAPVSTAAAAEEPRPVSSSADDRKLRTTPPRRSSRTRPVPSTGSPDRAARVEIGARFKGNSIFVRTREKKEEEWVVATPEGSRTPPSRKVELLEGAGSLDTPSPLKRLVMPPGFFGEDADRCVERRLFGSDEGETKLETEFEPSAKV